MLFNLSLANVTVLLWFFFLLLVLFNSFFTIYVETENARLKLALVILATEDKNNIVHEIVYSNCEAVYFGESTRSLKSRSDEHKRSVRNYVCDKNEIAKHCWGADRNFSWD